MLTTDDDGDDGVEIKRTYSLVEVAERLGRARTTLADWSRQFREFLPTVGAGRSMRYTEEAVEIFGLISKMKDANEPPESIREQLRGVVSEIIIPMTDDDEGKPYLMQLAGEIDQLKRAVVMLKTDNDGLRRELLEGRNQLAVSFEQVIRDDRSRRVDERLMERRIEKQLRDEALDLWVAKPETERLKKVGLFRKEENVDMRDRFVREYIHEHYEQRIREA